MSKAEKRLAHMRRNPRADWTIDDVRMACNSFGVTCAPPGGGSHWKVSHPSQVEILTIPAHRPIKAVYIASLVLFIDRVIRSES